jgi:hypothetical protein
MTNSLLLERSQPRRSAPRLPDSGGQAVTTEYQAQLAAEQQSASASASASEMASQSQSASQSESVYSEAMMPQAQVHRAQPLFEMPHLAADGSPMPAFRMSAQQMPGSDLASVIGGHTAATGTGHQGVEVVEGRSHRFAFAVLGIATLVGAVAAVLLQVNDDAPIVDAKTAPAKTNEAPAQPDKAVATDDTAAKPDPPKDDSDLKAQPLPKDDAPDKKPPDTTAPAPAPTTTDTTAAPAKTDETKKPDEKTDAKAAPDKLAATDTTKPKKIEPKRPAGTAAARKPRTGCQQPGTSDPYDPRPICSTELGTLKISSDPWATVYIDDSYVGETPLTFKVAAGRHYVRLTTASGVTKRDMIDVSSDVKVLRYDHLEGKR